MSWRASHGAAHKHGPRGAAPRSALCAVRFLRGPAGRPDRCWRRGADDAPAGPIVWHPPDHGSRHGSAVRSRQQKRRHAGAWRQPHSGMARCRTPGRGQRAGHDRDLAGLLTGQLDVTWGRPCGDNGAGCRLAVDCRGLAVAAMVSRCVGARRGMPVAGHPAVADHCLWRGAGRSGLGLFGGCRCDRGHRVDGDCTRNFRWRALLDRISPMRCR